MQTYRARVVCGLFAGLLTVGSIHAQQPARKVAKGTSLTAMDYIEIRQLVARYSYALDTAEDNGQAFARLFTPDGIFTTRAGGPGEIKGRQQLAAFARGDSKADGTSQGPLWVHTFVTNHIIQPTPQGATGRVYVVGIDIAEAGNPGVIHSGGRFEDVYVKSAEGWRIKQRSYVPIALGPRDDATQPRAQH
jgi:hypothetical protein